MEKTPAEEKRPAKTEAELIATVANIQDAEGSLLFAQRARKAGMPALAVACEERAKALTPIRPTRAKKRSAPPEEATGVATHSDQDGADGEIAAS
jgi:hypothetical protein